MVRTGRGRGKELEENGLGVFLDKRGARPRRAPPRVGLLGLAD